MSTKKLSIVVEKPKDIEENEQLAQFWSDKIEETFSLAPDKSYIVSVLFNYELKKKGSPKNIKTFKISQSRQFNAVMKGREVDAEQSALWILPSMKDYAKYLVITEFENQEIVDVTSAEGEGTVDFLIVPFQNIISITFKEPNGVAA